MTDNLDPGTATRAALAKEIERLRVELADCQEMRDQAGDEADARDHTNEELRAQRDAYLARLQQYDGEAYDRIRRQHAETYRELTAVRTQRDAARRDLATATQGLLRMSQALGEIRALCNAAEYVRLAENEPPDLPPVLAVAVTDLLAVLPAAGDDPAATGDLQAERERLRDMLLAKADLVDGPLGARTEQATDRAYGMRHAAALITAGDGAEEATQE